jgi:hypothetical protein
MVVVVVVCVRIKERRLAFWWMELIDFIAQFTHFENGLSGRLVT